MQLNRRQVGLCLAGLLLQGCSTAILKPELVSAETTGSGRFQLSGGALEQPINGRYEWGRNAEIEWVLLGDPWGGSLGELRRPLLSGAWQLKDAAGRSLTPDRVQVWLTDTLGLAAEQAEGQLAQLAQGFTSGAGVARSIQIQGQRGNIRLRLIPDLPSGSHP
jgi:hypothetical protein